MTNKVALLIDLDNLYCSISNNGGEFEVKSIIEMAQGYGRLVVKDAYADFGTIPREVQRELLCLGVRQINCPTLYRGNGNSRKNLTDQMMMSDIHQLLRQGIVTYVLVSGDGDFIPVILDIRNRGKMVVSVGLPETTNRYLPRVVDEFVSYPVEKARVPAPTQVLSDIAKLVE